MIENVVIDGISIELQRKKIKNMHLYVKSPNGKVVITAPTKMPMLTIENFVKQKHEWIVSNINRMQNSPVTVEPQYVSGEKISVWGDIYTLIIYEGSKFSLDLLDNGYAKFEVKKDATFEQKQHYMIEWYRKQLIERTDILLPKWEEYTGLRCSSWQSKVMKTRWGTCNTRTKKIWLNVYLAKYPVECLEYVILHELAHTVVPNHGYEFKSLVTEYMPDWKEKKGRLKTYESN